MQGLKTWLIAISHLPESFALLHRLANLWQLYSRDPEGTVQIDYLEQGSTITGTSYYTDLIRKVRAALKEKRQGKLHLRVLLH